MNIKDYIEKTFPKEIIFKGIESEKLKKTEWYFDSAKADAIDTYNLIKEFLNKEETILEVGGGLHLLTNFLKFKGYNITSIEPGDFTEYTYLMKKNISKISKSEENIKINTLENFSAKTEIKYDFIFSVNVLEHTKDIKLHLESCFELLKNNSSNLYVRCPNYVFPFECHFYKFFIPFAPKFTFKYLLKKSLVKKLGENEYNDLLNNINFKCTYYKIKNLDLPLKFENPCKEIFDRIENDVVFKERLFSSSLIKWTYNLISFLKLKKLISTVFPVSFNPYIVMKNKKN